MGARDDLPASNMVRWTQRRKALVVEAVRNGAISLTEACRRYELSVEEFRAWQRAVETDGEEASRVIRLKDYRGGPHSARGEC